MNALYSFPSTVTNPFMSQSTYGQSPPTSLLIDGYTYQSHSSSIEHFLETTPEACPIVLGDLVYSIIHSLRYPTVVGYNTSNSVCTDFHEFCRGILRRTQLSTRVIIIGLQYLNRLRKLAPQLCTQVGMERHLLTVSLILGMKYHEDIPYNNAAWSELTGIPVLIINSLEKKFLEILEFDLYFSETEYEVWIRELETKVKIIRNPFTKFLYENGTNTAQMIPNQHHIRPLSPQINGLISNSNSPQSFQETCGCKLDSCNDLVPCSIHLSQYPSLL
ncbi:hypothetical protein K7432_007152 [Basidiobolus ranarum]|uniref:Cyclin N-terminal domain-containing protein n=1 Tax=Basidiobolus ranarum TaxID=34480 RepID=A0ABR2WTT3_9FUNG